MHRKTLFLATHGQCGNSTKYIRCKPLDKPSHRHNRCSNASIITLRCKYAGFIGDDELITSFLCNYLVEPLRNGCDDEYLQRAGARSADLPSFAAARTNPDFEGVEEEHRP